MKRKLTSALILTSLSCMAFANGPVATSVSIELRPSAGTKVTYVMVEKTNTTISMMGQDMEMPSTSNSEYSLEAKKDSAGLKTFVSVFNSTVKEIDQMGTKIKINTIDPKADTTSETFGALNKFYRHLTGYPYTIYVANRGKVVSTSGAKEIYQNAVSKLDLTGPMAALKSMANESILTADLDKLFDFNPGKSIQSGDKWERKDTIVSNGMPMYFSTIYSLDKIEGNAASVKASSTINYEGDLDAVAGASARIMGTASGTFKVNTDNGLIISSAADLDMEIKLSVSGNEIPMKVSTKATVTAK